MTVQAWFRTDEIAIRPGATATISVAVENTGSTTETYTVTPAGLTASWLRVSRPTITLFAGSTDIVEVKVHPPALPSTTAGQNALAVRVMPQSDSDQAALAETVAKVAEFDDRRLSLLQPVQRSRGRASYDFLVENAGNGLANCRLHIVDPTDRVSGDFDPPAVGVAPGSKSLVRLQARARRSGFRRHERQLDFQIEATEPGHQPASVGASLIQPPSVPTSALWRLAAAAAVVALCWVAWATVVEPAIDDAADRAVAERLNEPTPPADVTNEDDGGNDDDATDQQLAPTAPRGDGWTAGTPESYRVAVEAGVTQQGSQSLQLPPDADFLLTDIVLQNPGGDDGSAALMRGEETLYEWDLGAMTAANEFQARVTPLPFEAGESIVLEIDCEQVGDTSDTGCQVAVLLTGVLVAP